MLTKDMPWVCIPVNSGCCDIVLMFLVHFSSQLYLHFSASHRPRWSVALKVIIDIIVASSKAGPPVDAAHNEVGF
jgi:hypothetical protein